MTKQQVIAKIGKPVSISTDGSAEYFNYALSTTDDQALNGVTVPCYVRLIDGKVVSYGRWGDLNSTKPPRPQSRPPT